MKTLAVIIPALNEEQAIASVIHEIPKKQLKKLGYATSIIVVDNSSTDDTRKIAKKERARVLLQPRRGYGNAYQLGFSKTTADIIATGDADGSYPFAELPRLIKILETERLDFISAERMTLLKTDSMPFLNRAGNRFLTLLANLLFGMQWKDSQSGMWLFRREILQHLNLSAAGMPFSQEIKNESVKKGFKCREIPVHYKKRIGKPKLRIIKDGFQNALWLVKKRMKQ